MSDIFKDSFLENFQMDIPLSEVVLALSIAVLLGLFIYLIYRIKIKNTFYNKDFNLVLAALPLITCAIVLSMQANIVISLGMVGALSIVRFRNAVKNSIDLLYLFWSISVGLICGAQLYLIAIVLCLVVTILILILDLVPNRFDGYLLSVVSDDLTVNERIEANLKNNHIRYEIKSCLNASGKYSVIYALMVKPKTLSMVETCLYDIDGIRSYNLLMDDGNNRV